MKSLVALVVALAAFAPQAHAVEPQTSSTLMGVWRVDTTKLPMPVAARPKSVTITFATEGANRLRARVEVVGPAGEVLEAEGVTPLDGTPTAVKSNFEADQSATAMPRPEVLIMQLAKNGTPASTRIYSVVGDGNSMIETVAFFDSDGRPVLRRNYFTRVR